MVGLVWLATLLLGAEPASGNQDACAAEVARVCPASRGDVLLLSCMRAHEAEISRACPGDMDALVAKAKEIGTDCDADAAKVCKDVAPGNGRIAACLRDNESSLSQSCQSAFNQWRLMRMRLQSACGNEIASLCKTVPDGGGRVWTCLRTHEQELGSDCRAALQKL